MGKVRVKTFDETENAEALAKKKAKREAKKNQKEALKAEKKPTVQDETETVSTPEEKIKTSNEEITTPEENITTVETPTEKEAKKRKKKEKFQTKKTDSDRVSANKRMVSSTEKYPLEKAVKLLAQFKKSSFDESVELHVNVKEKGISGTLKLPHGTGKTLKIEVADDAIIESISNGKIDFDVLIATPDMMPKLAKIARILGPRGLMPNPKNGTVTTNPDEAIKKLSGGEMRFKTEAKAAVIHLLIGKLSFGEDKLKENATTALEAIGEGKIKSATLTSTMSPGIKLAIH